MVPQKCLSSSNLLWVGDYCPGRVQCIPKAAHIVPARVSNYSRMQLTFFYLCRISNPSQHIICQTDPDPLGVKAGHVPLLYCKGVVVSPILPRTTLAWEINKVVIIVVDLYCNLRGGLTARGVLVPLWPWITQAIRSRYSLKNSGSSWKSSSSSSSNSGSSSTALPMRPSAMLRTMPSTLPTLKVEGPPRFVLFAGWT